VTGSVGKGLIAAAACRSRKTAVMYALDGCTESCTLLIIINYYYLSALLLREHTHAHNACLINFSIRQNNSGSRLIINSIKIRNSRRYTYYKHNDV